MSDLDMNSHSPWHETLKYGDVRSIFLREYNEVGRWAYSGIYWATWRVRDTVTWLVDVPQRRALIGGLLAHVGHVTQRGRTRSSQVAWENTLLPGEERASNDRSVTSMQPCHAGTSQLVRYFSKLVQIAYSLFACVWSWCRISALKWHEIRCIPG